MKQPTFSILIPTSGRADLIAMAVKSILDQTFRDFEIVIADLSGTEEVRSFEKSDSRIRYVFAPEGGLTTWDVAAKHAEGKYILWLDDDNYLLPFALDLFKRTIDRTHADIVSATHLYYYDRAHPRHYLRNNIGVVPFTGATHSLDPKKALEGIYAFARRGTGAPLPRFHFSATAVSRDVIQRAIRRLGFVLVTDVPNIHSLQPIVFAFAESCAFVDWPVVIVGRLGVSMSQGWSTKARERFRKKAFLPRLSPVHGYTRINGVLENLLRVRELLPDRLGAIPVNYEHFAGLYARELMYLDTELVTAVRNWREFFTFIETFPPEPRARLQREARKLRRRTPLVLIARRLGLHHFWRAVFSRVRTARRNRTSPRERMAHNQEFEIPIRERYHVNSIEDLARHIREIVLDQTGCDIASRPHVAGENADENVRKSHS